MIMKKKDFNNFLLEIQERYSSYNELYKEQLSESESILEYWENEFFWWKREAFADVLELLQKYNNQ